MTQAEGGKSTGTTAKKLPNTVAFKNKFTQEFMDSPEEVKDGYYLFKSKTGGYNMLFPINAEISKTAFEKHDNHYESLSFGEEVLDENISHYFNITYENSSITNNVSANLDLLSSYAGYKGKYEEFKHDNKTYYYAKEVTKDGNTDYYSYFSYIKSDKSEKAVRYFVDSTCSNQNKKCTLDQTELEKRFLIMMKSVDFLE
ncbi:hypothetical protein CVD19_11020 [Bacillus sp. T33-2]|nr:hypothetical protein CVD19_11020 [Bacillus sp. T33-2]